VVLPPAPHRYHLDIETDHVGAEVPLDQPRAVEVADGRTWVMIPDPSGHLFDVVPHESPWFAQRSLEVS